MVTTSAFQAESASPILATRSTCVFACVRHKTSLDGTGVYGECTIYTITKKRQGTCRPICLPADEEIRTKREKTSGCSAVW